MITDKVDISPVNMKDRQNLAFSSGDTLRVWVKIKDVDTKGKDRTRSQAFEGIVLARKHGNEAGATFTVRKVIDGVGVERIFPLYSPMIEKIEILRQAKMRRAKLYYIRDKAAKEIRRRMRNIMTTKETPPEATEGEKVEASQEASQAKA